MGLNDHSPVKLAIGALFFVLIARYLLSAIQKDRKIRSLGGKAPRIRSWAPGGVDFILGVIASAKNNKTLVYWQTFMKRDGNPNRPHTAEIHIVGQRLILTADEENIKAILATQFADYGKGATFHDEWHDFLGDSIFTTDGTMWHDSRQLIRPQFIKDRVSDLHIFEKHVQTLISLLGGPQPGSTVDMADVLYKFTLDVTTDFLLGASVQSMVASEQRFADAFAYVQHVQSLIARAGPLNILVPRKKFRKELKIMDDFIQPFIEQTLRLSPEELEKKSKSDEGYTFLHALANFTRDPKVLRDQLTAVLLAGRDTTATALSWLFYELSRHPKIVEKLRQEIAQTCRDAPPTYSDLKSMRYLSHTINETLRLYPIVPFNVRIALKDTTLPRGGGPDGMQPIGVLEGTPVGYSTLTLQRRADIYPATSEKFADPLEFSPERWDDWNPKMWTYIPFNGGPRICIGQQFALTEIGYTTVRILQAYSRVKNVMTEVPGLRADIVMQPSDGVHVVFSK